MTKFIRKNLLAITGIAIGALAGFLYWKYIGCASGTCPITSSPVISTIWGALIGGLIFSAFGKKNLNNQTKMKTINMTKADFIKKIADYENNPEQWKYLGDKPALVEFYAPWCGHCRALAPVLEDLAEKNSDKIYIYIVNTENEQDLSAAFGIQSIPTMLFVPMQGMPQMMQGAAPEKDIQDAIDRILIHGK